MLRRAAVNGGGSNGTAPVVEPLPHDGAGTSI